MAATHCAISVSEINTSYLDISLVICTTHGFISQRLAALSLFTVQSQRTPGEVCTWQTSDLRPVQMNPSLLISTVISRFIDLQQHHTHCLSHMHCLSHSYCLSHTLCLSHTHCLSHTLETRGWCDLELMTDRFMYWPACMFLTGRQQAHTLCSMCSSWYGRLLNELVSQVCLKYGTFLFE